MSEAASEAFGADPEAALREGIDRGVRLLAQREHSARELERKLLARGLDASLVVRVLDELKALDLQSDERFAESFLQSRLRRGQGPLRIRQGLLERGLKEREIEQVLTQTTEFWVELAEAARRKRFSERPTRDAADAWGAQARFLSRRGFPSDVVYAVLDPRD